MDFLTQMETDFNYCKNEEEVFKFWQENEIYKKIVLKNEQKIPFQMCDGPPFVSSDNLHFGHIHIGFMKSCMLNYMNMKGYNVSNKVGYDVHGLPIEQKVSDLLNLHTKQEIEEFGIGNYNQKCKEVINKFAGEWQPIFNRMGRFLDFKNEYKTMDLNYMETNWWVFKQLWDKDLIYRGFKIMPFSTKFGTPLSNFETSGEDSYREVMDPAIYVKFKVREYENTYIIAWTTTPWTLPSNLSLCMSPKLKYLKVKDLKTDEIYILAETSINNLYPEIKKDKNKKDGEVKNLSKVYEILSIHDSKEFENMEYEPLFNYFPMISYKVVLDSLVDADSGSGIVHLAPAFGMEDYDVCVKNKIVDVQNIGDFCPVTDYGLFTNIVKDFEGEHVLTANKKIIEFLKDKVVRKEFIKHKYPFCPRSDLPLIYKTSESIFLKVTDIKDQLVANNKKITWEPNHIKEGRFGMWLENAKDWCLSRNRFFGTPIPMWVSEDFEEVVCIGSIDELVKEANLKERPTDLHREFIDSIQIPSKQGKGMLKRVTQVLDCWFESGCVPLAQLHYPFENKNYFDNREFLSDFICEGIDQTRGWFYTLMVISTAIFNKPAFKKVICSGLILADDGKKFSKRLGNYISPFEVFNNYGSDSLRMYLISSPAAHADSFKFSIDDISSILKKYIQWFNCFKFLIEHIIKYEKQGFKFNKDTYKKSQNIMDGWILSRLRIVIINISKYMDELTIYKVKNEIFEFIEDLTNWYIKFNRNRLRGRFCSQSEQGYAISILYHVVITFSKITAPFIPFLSETIYRKLKQLLPIDLREISVHLCDFPNSNDYIEDFIIERKMKRLQFVAGLVRSLRAKNNQITSAKIPLKSITIINDNKSFLEDLRDLERYLKEEINSITINYNDTIDKFVKYKLLPNNKSIGTKYKSLGNSIKEKLNLTSEEQIKKYVNKLLNEITIEVNNETVSLTKEDFEITSELIAPANKNESIIIEDGTIVIVNSTIDDEVLELYIMRLFIVGVQNMRKVTKLRPWDKINIYYKTTDKLINLVVSKFYEKIVQELIYKVFDMDLMKTNEEEILPEKEKDKLDWGIKTINNSIVKFKITRIC